MSESHPGLRLAQSHYPAEMFEPMEKELESLGVHPLRTPDEVDSVLGSAKGTVFVVVNSVCGCAAGQCRPGVALALQSSVKPERAVTVFAGVDRDATERARAYFEGYPPSSPQLALLKDGKVVSMLQRHDIESRSAEEVAEALISAFEQHCQS